MQDGWPTQQEERSTTVNGYFVQTLLETASKE